MPPPASPASVLARARKLADEGREPEAAAWLEAHPGPETDRLHLEIATRAAADALQRRDRATARAWLDRGLGRSPADASLNFFRGNLHLDAGHATEAAACFRCCVAADPRREEFVCHLGLALLAAGQPSAAAEGLAALPDSAAAQLHRSRALAALGDFAAAAVAAERSGRLRHENFETWLQLAVLREQLGDLAGAAVAANRATVLCPASAPARSVRDRVLARLGHPAGNAGPAPS